MWRDLAVAFAVVLVATVARADAGLLAAGLAPSVLAGGWLAALGTVGAYGRPVLGRDTAEFRRVLLAGGVVLAVAGTLSYVSGSAPGRSVVVAGLPLLVALGLASRWVARWHRRRCRHRPGRRRVVLAGPATAVQDVAHRLAADDACDIVVVGAVAPRAEQAALSTDSGLNVLGGYEHVGWAVEATEAEAVVVLPDHGLDGPALRRMAWSLEGSGADLVVAPGLTEVDAPRVSLDTVGGVPLVLVDNPRLSSTSRVLKGAFDRVTAAVALLLVAPLLLVVLAAIRLSGPGPVLFRQRRVGRLGREFTVVKLRTMVDGAEGIRPGLVPLNEQDGPLFKIREDPRVTRLGRWLRRYSVDELPQLVNVVRGDMSLVGPRPPLPEEVTQYDEDVRRRLLVKPGLTGLWQVSGRSDLSWEESVRLDLRYVDNWSLAYDLRILARTGKAVLSGAGAY